MSLLNDNSWECVEHNNEMYNYLDKIILRISSNLLEPTSIKPSKKDIKYALKNYEINYIENN